MAIDRGGGTDSLTVAAADIGSNSIKMTVARLSVQGTLEEVGGASETVRLGAGLDETGRLSDDRVDAALIALSRFADTARGLGATRLVGVATEATRAAANGSEFLARVRNETGWDVRVISGDEEAELTFRGLSSRTDVSGRIVVADIGGGSTEIIRAENGHVLAANSLALGSGRLTDRHVRNDPPDGVEQRAMRAAAKEALANVELPYGPSERLIVVGGTGEYLTQLIPNAGRITLDAIEVVLARLRSEPAAALAAALGIQEARARVLPAGVAIVAAVVDRMAPGRIETARSGIRAGLLLEALGQQGAPV